MSTADRTKVEALLSALGGSVEEIADTLAVGGHTGNQGSAGSCPVANYLKANGVPGASVRASDSSFGGGHVTNPQPVTDFIRSFDEAKLPFLVNN